MQPGLCLKSGNAVILRGGSEAIHSNQAIAQCIKDGLEAAGLPAAAVQVVETTDRAAVGEMLRMKEIYRCHYSSWRQEPDRTHQQ